MGFRAVWTEVRLRDRCSDHEFACHMTHFCISKALKCNSINNCGKDVTGSEDKSDETDCKHLRFIVVETTIAPVINRMEQCRY